MANKSIERIDFPNVKLRGAAFCGVPLERRVRRFIGQL